MTKTNSLGRMVTWGSIAAGASVALISLPASAQETTGQAQAGGSVTTQTTVSTPTATPSTPAAPAHVVATTTTTHVDDESPDHERFVGRFAVGYFGISQLPIASDTSVGGGALAASNVNAPVVGVRYWLQPNLGLDIGLGFGLSSGSREVVNGATTTSTDAPSHFGFALHGGVPLAFAHGRHYSFLVIPEATVGIASGTVKGNGANIPDTDLSGFKLDLGGRIGAEIHFGFIGIPELSLEGSVGLFFQRESIKAKSGSNSSSAGDTGLGTSVQSDPWAIFVNNISAFYYF